MAGYWFNPKTGRMNKLKPAPKVRLTKGEKRLCRVLSGKSRTRKAKGSRRNR